VMLMGTRRKSMYSVIAKRERTKKEKCTYHRLARKMHLSQTCQKNAPIIDLPVV
jgi:hypothetical protein